MRPLWDFWNMLKTVFQSNLSPALSPTLSPTLWYNSDAFREAIINAFLHNAWIKGNEPMVTIYSDPDIRQDMQEVANAASF